MKTSNYKFRNIFVTLFIVSVKKKEITKQKKEAKTRKIFASFLYSLLLLRCSKINIKIIVVAYILESDILHAVRQFASHAC